MAHWGQPPQNVKPPCKHNAIVYVRISQFGRGNWACADCKILISVSAGQSDKPTFTKKEKERLKFLKWLYERDARSKAAHRDPEVPADK